MPIAHLNRSVFRLTGEGLLPWLEGIITNSLTADMTFAALLTPQGKIIADFFVTKTREGLLIDTPVKFSADLFKRLRMYKLRAPIEIKDVTDTYGVYAVWDAEVMDGYPDPRHAALGNRFITQGRVEGPMQGAADYNAHRLSLGVVESEWDFDTTKVFPADANMDLMNGVDFKKGCFVGQEVVSRMKRMTTVKKRMRGLIIPDGVEVGDRVLAGERVIGDIVSVQGLLAMGLIRLDRLSEAEQSPTIKDIDVTIMDSVDGQQH